jgi:hypothetical protein
MLADELDLPSCALEQARDNEVQTDRCGRRSLVRVSDMRLAAPIDAPAD